MTTLRRDVLAAMASCIDRHLPKGELKLGWKDDFGQRIDIEIELPGQGISAGKGSYLTSRWMILSDSSIKLKMHSLTFLGVMMPFELFSRVRYVGPKMFCDELSFGDIGYVIEDYGQGNYEVEFLLSNGDAKAQLGVPEVFLEHIEVP